MTDVQAIIPPGLPGATKTWRKTLTEVSSKHSKGYAFMGDWLDAGARYAMPQCGLILGYDRVDEQHVITVWRADADGLPAAVKTITRKGRTWAGPATTKAITKLAEAHPWPQGRSATMVKAGPNREPGRCRICREIVPAGEGTWYQGSVLHVSGGCPQLRNDHAGACHRCGSWIEVRQGVLVRGPDTVVHGGPVRQWRVVHPGDCPPLEEFVDQPDAPPLPNKYPGQCGTCWQTVDAQAGIYRAKRVWHPEGGCPPAGDEPTWVVHTSRPGRYLPRADRGFTNGQVLRATVSTSVMPVPADAPGVRPVRAGWVSMVGVIVAEAAPFYSRQADGDTPAGLAPGEDGWVFTGRVRAATEQEAAPVLAKEGARARRADLTRQGEQLARHDDRVRPEVVDPAVLELPGVHVGRRAIIPGSWTSSYGVMTHLRVDEPGGVVWICQYNGLGGDNWSSSNCGSYIVWRLDLTADRLQLVQDLAGEFGRIT